ncbi:MAG: hypothetical protein ACJ79S_06405, partial [Gemmatimonadaceae bacterium]
AAPFAYPLLLAALATGTARRSRGAASLLLAVTVWIEGGTWWARHNAAALVFLAVFGVCYAVGVRGAFEWHRLERERQAAGTAPGAAV